jgi:uncharacterized RDD family membrane protein YckC
VATPPPRANATRASASPRLPARARRRLTVATATRQLGAGLIDGVGIAIVTFAFMRLVLAQQGTRPTLQGVVDALHVDVMTGLPLVLMVPVAAVLWHLLAVPLVGTPGQRALGLALTTMTGARPGAGRLAVRAAVQGVAVGAFLAGPAFALFIDGRRRGPGDIVARTVAVRREAPSAHGEAPASRDGVKG